MRYLLICFLMVFSPLAASSAVSIPYGSCSSGNQRIVTATEGFKRIYIADGEKLTSVWLGKNGNFYQSRVITEPAYAASIRRSLGNRIINMASLRTNPLYYRDASGKYFKLVASDGRHGVVLKPVALTGSELAAVQARFGSCRSDGSSGGGSSSTSSSSSGADEEPIDDDPVNDGGHDGSDPLCRLTGTCGSSSTSSSSGSGSTSSSSSSSTSSSSSSGSSSSSSSTSSSSSSSSTSSSSGANPRVGLSGLPWNSGNWVNGGNDRLQIFEAYRGRRADAVTQSLQGMDTWAQHAGADSEDQVNREFSQTPANFQPAFNGIFKKEGWMKHIWGNAPATEHRKRIIHFAWMNALPKDVGNGYRDGRYKNPRAWRAVKDGSADKYMFLLGRKFAYLDQRYGDTDFPMSIDLAYEFTLLTHPDIPEGSYQDGATTRYAYQDFPAGWSRMARVFREGYKYQRGRACNYRFSWRPQLRFITDDRTRGGRVIPHDQIWPNLAANDNIANPVVINGVTVLPAGPLGRQADLVGASWHDSSKEYVKGSSITETGNNWQKILNGFPSHWGLQQMADFADRNGVKVVLPEWAARSDRHPPASPNPGDFYRLTFYFLQQNANRIAYETVFDIGSGNLYNSWSPPPRAGQDPRTVYKQLWGR